MDAPTIASQQDAELVVSLARFHAAAGSGASLLQLAQFHSAGAGDLSMQDLVF